MRRVVVVHVGNILFVCEMEEKVKALFLVIHFLLSNIYVENDLLHL